MKQWRTEHLRSELTFKGSAPGLEYPDGDHYGIKWSKAFSEVRFTVASGAAFPIQNLSLSIGTEDNGDAITGMALSDNEPEGCVIRRPREGLGLPPVVFRGIDGSRADISPFMNDEMSKTSPFRNHYDLLCQRILAGETIALVIGSITPKQNGNMSVPPSRLHVKGEYETTPAEGSKRIPVNEFIPVYTLPPWK